MNKIKNLYGVYNKGFEPPKWILKISNLEEYMKSTIVYYDKDAKDYKDLIKYRIPVNIGMKLYYNKNLMEKYFYYSESKYNQKSSNIAVFTKTPTLINNKKYDINVINVIAPALDSEEQFDYIKIINKIGYSNTISNEQIYKDMLEKCFKKIKKCFITFDTLILCGFGLGAFSFLCKKLEINCNSIFKECFNKYFSKSKKIIFLNYLDFIKGNSNNIININNDIYDIIINSDNLNKTLFVNAWDPYSLVGNGNNLDNSLDGYFGRISAMSVLCWSITNPYIKEVMV